MTLWQATDGTELALHMRGKGQPVVFQHGLCGDARQTFEAFPEIPGQRLLTLECRGHGASAQTGPFSICQFADDLITMITGLDRPVILGGISMGSAIATWIAVKRPDLVRALILVRPAWLTAAAPANMQPNAEVGRLIGAQGAAGLATFNDSATAKRLAAEAPDNLASLRGFFERKPLDVTSTLLQTISADGPGVTDADLGALALPTLVCGTTEDAIHPLAMAEHLATLIPGAALVRLPPKGRDKPLHLASLHGAITAFVEELRNAKTRP